MDELKVFTGNAHPDLARGICDYLKIPLGKSEAFEFANGNTFVKILENVRERDIFVVQPICAPVNTRLMELLIMLDALKRASAGRIAAVTSYYGYSRTDKKDQPRVPITARLVADLITTAGADRVLTVDLHAAQIQGFFTIPVDELTALTLISQYIMSKKLKKMAVVATDIGITKRARDLAAKLNAPLVIIEKRRVGNDDSAELLNIIGEIEGMTAILIDDEIDTAGSLVSAVSALTKAGAGAVYSCCTHPVFSGPAIERIDKCPVKEVICTDTVPVPPKKRNGKITVLSIANLLGEAIRRIHAGESIGAMFQD
ncbi:MAG: ribose-phosphate pyrophosphokinase [Dehalococcoidia bacterium]